MTANAELLARNTRRREELERLNTKVLLDYLAWARKFNGSYTPNDCYYFTVEQIKTVLATREHVPNRHERRRLRQEEAKRKKHR